MEAKIMSNVPGWEAGKSVYHSQRCAHMLLFAPDLVFNAAYQVGPLL